MKIVDSRTMADIDRRAQEEYGIPGGILMENAGIKAYRKCLDLYPELMTPDCRLVFAAGSGNNGGDGLVMARQAVCDGLRPVVVLSGDVRSDTAVANLEMARSLAIPVYSWETDRDIVEDAVDGAALIVDGLFGTGISGPLREAAAALVSRINNSAARVVSIDVPSGVGDGFEKGFPAVHADVTICLGLPKRCLYLPYARPLCGKLIHLPIGFPPALLSGADACAELVQTDELEDSVPEIPSCAHKSSRGKLAIFAGSRGTTGAPVLAAESAARSRCGLVSLFVEDEVFAPIASQLTSVMVKPWSHGDGTETFDYSKFDAFLAGPGWGFEGRLQWLMSMISSGVPGVLDADALTLLADADPVPDLGGRVILTPHPGEMARICKGTVNEVLADPFAVAAEVSKRLNAIVVLKGHVTAIASPDGRVAVNDGMNPALGTGGSGDVLSGIIAGILAGGLDAREAAILGVLVHVRIAAECFEENGWFLAEDLVPRISGAFRSSR